MSRSILLLRLEGPLQSWGLRSRWDSRDTGSEPTKSGVIGLIGCALGCGRNDTELERLDRSLLFGVRADRPGVVATDFHTVTQYHQTASGEFRHSGGTAKKLEKAFEHDEATVVSHREYLHDAAFLVALSSGENGLLRQLAGEAEHAGWFGDLNSPRWPLYLGRKSCVPSRPVFERLTDEYGTLEDALRREPLVAPRTLREEKSTQRTGRRVVAWLETSEGEYERQDALRINQLRFYGFRRCKRIEIDVDTGSPERGEVHEPLSFPSPA